MQYKSARVQQYDADEFKQVRCKTDADCVRPDTFRGDVLYVIEDVRGTVPGKSFLPLSAYDLIIYVEPGLLTHILLWMPRLWRWFQNGKFAWERDVGWKGTKKPYDVRNIIPIAREFLKTMRKRGEWIREDRAMLAGTRHIILHPVWFPTGIKWTL